MTAKASIPAIAAPQDLGRFQRTVADYRDPISVGARNPFRHPSPEALARLEAAGARVYRTDRDGAVILETDGTVLRVTAWARGVTDTFSLEDPESTTAPG